MHQEAIISEARKIFDNLSHFPDFYLAGGTGLALQLGHRISVDFDLFWEKDVPHDLLSKVSRVFKDFQVEVVVNHSEQLTTAIEKINLTFCKYPFPVILEFIEYQGIKILTCSEIAAMKAYALGRRVTFKDYVDLYFVFKEKIATLEDVIALCKKKYGKEFNPRLFLEQLVYLKDVEKMEIQFLKEKVTFSKLERFFEQEVKRIKI